MELAQEKVNLSDDLLRNVLQSLSKQDGFAARLCCRSWARILRPSPQRLIKNGKIGLQHAATLARVQELSELRLTDCSTIYALAIVTQLTRLEIKGRVADLAALCELPKLVHLRLSLVDWLGDDGTEENGKGLEARDEIKPVRLVGLELSNGIRLSSATLIEVSACCQSYTCHIKLVARMILRYMDLPKASWHHCHPRKAAAALHTLTHRKGSR